MFGIGNYYGLGSCYPYYNTIEASNYSVPPIIKPKDINEIAAKAKEEVPMEEQGKTAKVLAFGTLAIIAAAAILKGKMAFSKLKNQPGVFRRMANWFGDAKINIGSKLTNIKSCVKNKIINAKSYTANIVADAKAGIKKKIGKNEAKSETIPAENNV